LDDVVITLITTLRRHSRYRRTDCEVKQNNSSKKQTVRRVKTNKKYAISHKSVIAKRRFVEFLEKDLNLFR